MLVGCVCTLRSARASKGKQSGTQGRARFGNSLLRPNSYCTALPATSWAAPHPERNKRS